MAQSLGYGGIMLEQYAVTFQPSHSACKVFCVNRPEYYFVNLVGNLFDRVR